MENTSNNHENGNNANTVLAPVFVYEFLYNSDCCESAAATISIHKTKKGAEMAMEFHKAEIKREWDEQDYAERERLAFPFDYDQWWGVRECELLP
jgi:hypothetical protein